MLNLICLDEYVFNNYPIQKYSKVLNWYKNIPKKINNNSTARTCPGINEYLSTSYAMLWNFDVDININNNNFIYTPANLPVKEVSYFSADKYGVHTPLNNKVSNILIKIDMLWEIKGKGKLLTIDPFYNYETQYRTVPGIIDPDKTSTISVLLEPLNNNITIKQNTVACLFIPLLDTELNIML